MYLFYRLYYLKNYYFIFFFRTEVKESFCEIFIQYKFTTANINTKFELLYLYDYIRNDGWRETKSSRESEHFKKFKIYHSLNSRMILPRQYSKHIIRNE